MFRNKSLNTGLLLLRVTVGGLLLLHGLRKVEKPKESMGHISDVLEKKGLPPVMAVGSYVGEVAAPVALILGYRTRLMAPIITFNMLMAIYTVNLPKIDKREDSGAWGLEVQAFYLFGGLVLFYTGGGKYAISHHSKWD